MRNILQYFNERFPVIPVLLFATGYAGLLIGNVYGIGIWKQSFLGAFSLFITVSGIFLCFLFRQRVVDEFRDYAHDSKYFPNRPVQRGLVTKSQVFIMGLVALLMELVLVSRIAPLLLYLPVLFYNFLMAKDFFIKNWLDGHFTTHFFIHETFFIIYGWFFITSLSSHLSFARLLPVLGILVFGPMTVELIRKYTPRRSSRGGIVKDSYCAVWGAKNTLCFLMLLTFLLGFQSSLVKSNQLFIIVAAVIILTLLLLRKSDKLVIFLGAGQYLLFSLLANLF